jgi:CDP-diacylglycerol--glycerol-3-phosphate 3-phosphatidyltransferase
MLDGRWRAKAERGLDPVGKALYRIGISANGLTIAGLVIAAATAVAIGTGHLFLAFFGVVLTGVPDLLDGSVARYSGKAGPRGAFFDSVADRVSDALLFGGVAWHLADESEYLPVLVLAVLALSMLVTYERARAESLGFSARGGLMERAERMVFLSIGLLFDILVPMMWVMLALTVLTAVHRFVNVWRQASRADAVGPTEGAVSDHAIPGHTIPSAPEHRVTDDRRRTRARRLSRVPGWR